MPLQTFTIATVALYVLDDSLSTIGLPKFGCLPGSDLLYSSHVTVHGAGGGNDSLRTGCITNRRKTNKISFSSRLREKHDRVIHFYYEKM